MLKRFWNGSECYCSELYADLFSRYWLQQPALYMKWWISCFIVRNSSTSLSPSPLSLSPLSPNSCPFSFPSFPTPLSHLSLPPFPLPSHSPPLSPPPFFPSLSNTAIIYHPVHVAHFLAGPTHHSCIIIYPWQMYGVSYYQMWNLNALFTWFWEYQQNPRNTHLCRIRPYICDLPTSEHLNLCYKNVIIYHWVQLSCIMGLCLQTDCRQLLKHDGTMTLTITISQ